MVEKYGVVTIQSSKIKKYKEFYLGHDINQVDDLKTAWDNFNADTPGICEIYSIDGKTVVFILLSVGKITDLDALLQ